MAVGIIIHISVGPEKRTELFSEPRLSIGADETCDLQIHTKQVEPAGLWIELQETDGVFRVVEFEPSLTFTINDKPIRRFIAISDGDVLRISDTDISFAFFSISEKQTLITTNREPMIAQFIEEAALESAVSTKRDDAKTFLREFTRELLREVSVTTKLIALVLAIGFITGVLYLGFAVNRELRESREAAEKQTQFISELEKRLAETKIQIGQIGDANEEFRQIVSLAPNLRLEYGDGVCLIVGVYDLVDRATGKTLKYADPMAFRAEPLEQTPSEDPNRQPQGLSYGLTTEGSGSPVEYDFIGTGFHVGGGYIVTNRHVLQPWTEDDVVKGMMAAANGRARVKRLVIYFPNHPQPFALRKRELSSREDLAVATIDVNALPDDVPVLPLETDSDAATIGKSVVTIGYPSGPDRLLAMVDENEAKSINERFGNSRQNLINFLAQSRKIAPLTTQGSITDLDTRRIVHDAKTAEGGSGAPLFGQTGKVIGVNFGVFTENTAANMAVPIRFALDLLKSAGWTSPSEAQPAQPTANANTAAANSQASALTQKNK
ncbi:MAG: trypsin-like peptidase domain-containing protein [Pyrinomonadaceae bacterium]